MSTITTEINNFVHSQVSNGNCKNEVEAEKRIVGEIGAKAFLRSIEESRQQYRDGTSTPVNEKTTKEFMQKLAKKLIPNN